MECHMFDSLIDTSLVAAAPPEKKTDMPWYKEAASFIKQVQLYNINDKSFDAKTCLPLTDQEYQQPEVAHHQITAERSAGRVRVWENPALRLAASTSPRC